MNKDHPQAAELFNAENLPAFHDPFAGGGTIPLEAQRLGLVAFASDLNPVSVLINKAMVEIPPKFIGRDPVGPLPPNEGSLGLDSPRVWPGTTGLAEDVRRYGAWMRIQAEKHIGHLYPLIDITEEMAHERSDLTPLVGQKLTAIAWLWARTVKSPNPAFSDVDVPLVSTFVLAQKKGKEAYVQPVVEDGGYRFTVAMGIPPKEAQEGTKANGRGANFRCIISGSPIGAQYIRAEALAGRMGQRLMAVVTEGARNRIYLSPTRQMEETAQQAVPSWKPDVEFFQQALGFRVGNYGMTKWSDLFTARQLVALTTLSDLVGDAREQVKRDAQVAGLPDDATPLANGGTSTNAYADAVATYLSLFLSRLINLNNALCQWRNNPAKEHVGHLFARQAIPMVWDFAEANPIGNSGGSFDKTFDFVPKVLRFLPAGPPGFVAQFDAAAQSISSGKIVSTDPPYYDNIGYADLSDFFYVWLRPSLRPIFPDLFATLAVPKAEELVATPDRHGGKPKAEAFFLSGMTEAMHRLAEHTHPAFPITIYYAFKQSETEGDSGTSSTGWVTFLEAVHRAGLQLSGTWPMRTELANRMRGSESNALASSIVLVCRKRAADAVKISRREFIRELNGVLPEALDEMTKGAGGEYSPVAPVDLSQAIIGPGMAVFSKYAAVLEADGTPMSVRTALQLINRFLAEDDFDAETQFCLHWFEQNKWTEGTFGDADTLSRGKGTSVERMKEVGVLQSGSGIVRLLKWVEYPADWDPRADKRIPVWEALHHLIRALKQGGESASGALLSAFGGQAEAVRQLAYRLYTLCERLGQAEDARSYNELITSWTGIEVAAHSAAPQVDPQGLLFQN